jgi:hypothetical protein
MATPTRVPEVEPTPTGTNAPTVVLPDSAVIRPIPPERATPPPPETTRGFWAAIIGLGVLLLLAVGVIVWQQGRVDDAESALTATETELQVTLIEAQQLQADLDRAEAQLAQAQTEVEGLERRVERLEAKVTGTTAKNEEAQAALQETQAELRQTQNELSRAQTNEAEARAAASEATTQLNAIAGNPLADGTWNGRMYMFGGTQVPPMLAYDERKLFRGQDAIDAMIADGISQATAEACGSDCVYWRNPSNGWRIMEISPYATVTLHSYGPDPTTMDLAGFTRAFNGTDARSARIASVPYRITMAGGQVTGIEEVRVGW